MNSILSNCVRKMNRQIYQSIKYNYLAVDVMHRNYMQKSQILDKEYFENVLKGFYKDDNIRVNECRGGDRSSIQPSFMSEVKKFTLVGLKENKKFELDVIVKQLHSKEHQELYKSNIAAQNEKNAYNTIFPQLNVYKDATLPVPVCLFADDEKIIIEDLCSIKYKPFDKKKGFITPKECIYTLKALAKFHAATIVLANKNSETLKKIKNLPKEILYSDAESPLLKHQQESLQNILTNYMNRKPTEENESKVKALQYLIKFAKNDVKDLLCKNEDNNYVFCHGDLQLTNFLSKQNKEIQKDDEYIDEMDIKFIDFQKMYYCSVASDLVYFLFINLKPDDFIKYKNHILNRYLYFLLKNIEDCGVKVNLDLLNYEWLTKEMDRFTEYGIIYALWVLPMFDAEMDNNQEVTKEMLDAGSKSIFYNERMEKWVDYYSKVFKEKSEK